MLKQLKPTKIYCLLFKFQYPSQWKGNLFEVSDGVYFDINPVSQKDVGVNRTGLSVAVLPMHQSAHEWFREYLYENKGTDYSTLRTSETKLSDFPATMATWDIKNDNIVQAKALSVFAVIDKTVYHIHYEVSPDLILLFFAQVYKITNTFQII